MKINKKIMCSVIAVNILLTIIGYVVNKTVVKNELNSDIKATTEEKSKSAQYIIEQKKNTAESVAKWFEDSDELLNAINENNRSDIIEFGEQAMDDFNLDHWVVTDIKGNVILRAEQPDEFGDNIANEVNIQKAIEGELSSGIEKCDNDKISILAGCPIRDKQGEIAAIVSTGYVLSDRFVDEMNTTLNCDITIFNGITRASTTLKENEKRITGTKLTDSEIKENVLNKGENESKIVEIYGEKYYSAYSPLIDANNEIIGMIFVGEPEGVIQLLINKLTIYQLIISFGTVLISLLVLSFILRKYLSIPLNNLVNFFKELSNGEGDLTKTMNITTNDEVSNVIEEFNSFILKLRSIISEVKDSSHIVKKESINLSNSVTCCTNSMIEISDIVSKISENMMGNSASLQETTACTHEMNRASNMVAQSCMVVSEQSVFANEITEEGSKAINDIITSIQTISDSSMGLNEKMNELNDLSNKINDIINIITEIAEETNMLSINASIEAARAGEHGKGFDIVAQEIRSLANESSESSNEIINLIHEVQCKINDTTTKVQMVSENVNSGVEQAKVVDRRFKCISEAISVVSEKTHDIAAAAEQQVASVEQISIAIDEITKITVSTAEDSCKMKESVKQEKERMEKADTATKRVTKIVKELNSIVDKFKTK